jgi:hypothetical protein
VQGPPVVDDEVENAQDQDEHDGAKLGLEANNNHDAGDKSKCANYDSPNAPLASKHKADEQKDEQDTSGKLNVHLAILFIELGEASEGFGFTNPAVGEHHEEPTNNGEVAKEEVEVKDQTVSESLGDNNAEKAKDGVVGVLADYDHDRRRGHSNDVDDEEDVR